MKPIIARIDRELLKKELSPDKFLRPTNKAHRANKPTGRRGNPAAVQLTNPDTQMKVKTGQMLRLTPKRKADQTWINAAIEPDNRPRSWTIAPEYFEEPADSTPDPPEPATGGLCE